MGNFFEEHLDAIIYAAAVLGAVALLILTTKLLHHFLCKKAKKRFPNEEPITLNLLKRIGIALWIILGIIALSFIFIDKDLYGVAKNNFRTVFHVGFVSILTIISASIIQTFFDRLISKKVKEKQDPTSYKFARYLAVLGVYFIGALLAILAFPSLKSIAQTALGGAGVLAVILGVASQEAFANLIGGIFIVVFKPFIIGDVIKITDEMVGTVTDITLRHTIIRNFQNMMIVIPNAIINKERLVNYDLGERKCCQYIEIGISYESDINLAKKIMRDECEAHPNLIDNRTYSEINKEVDKIMIRLTALSDSSVILRAYTWAADFPSAFAMKCDLLESIKKRFDTEGVEIAYPHRTIVFKKEQLEALKKQAKA